MRASPVVLCCWPGLPRLWLLGDWSALMVAIGFGVVLNLLLLASFVWTEVLPAPAHTVAWLLVGGVWFFSALRSYRALPNLGRPVVSDERGLFIQAQGEYLKGHWFEAESLLQQLLQSSRHDIDAHFMLATLCRHTQRYDDARARLDLIEQFESAEKWRWEIDVERRILQRRVQESRQEVKSISSADGEQS